MNFTYLILSKIVDLVLKLPVTDFIMKSISHSWNEKPSFLRLYDLECFIWYENDMFHAL